MKEVVKFLTENPNGFLATVDNDRARVRPFQFMLEKNDRLYFCTANTKNVYGQLIANPKIEYSSMNSNFEWIRVNGEAEFENNIEIKAEIIEINPLVKSLYLRADNPLFEVFYIKNGNAVIADFSGNPPKQYLIK